MFKSRGYRAHFGGRGRKHGIGRGRKSRGLGGFLRHKRFKKLNYPRLSRGGYRM